MYLRGIGSCLGCASCDGKCGDSKRLAGMGVLGWDDLLMGAMSAYGASKGGKGGGGGAVGGGGMMPTQLTSATNVSTNVQVSPQISPNFIQQQQPQNSPVNASAVAMPEGPTAPITAPVIPSNSVPMPTSGAIPSTPVTGAIPYIDTVPNVPNISQYPPATYAPSNNNGINTNTLLYGSLGLLGVALVAKYFTRRGKHVS